jgi:hypothetical protein
MDCACNARSESSAQGSPGCSDYGRGSARFRRAPAPGRGGPRDGGQRVRHRRPGNTAAPVHADLRLVALQRAAGAYPKLKFIRGMTIASISSRLATRRSSSASPRVPRSSGSSARIQSLAAWSATSPAQRGGPAPGRSPGRRTARPTLRPIGAGQVQQQDLVRPLHRLQRRLQLVRLVAADDTNGDGAFKPVHACPTSGYLTGVFA